MNARGSHQGRVSHIIFLSSHFSLCLRLVKVSIRDKHNLSFGGIKLSQQKTDLKNADSTSPNKSLLLEISAHSIR